MSDPLTFLPGTPILVCRTDRVGDLVLAMPLINTLARRYPESPIDVMASVYASPVLDHHPTIRNVIRTLTSQLRHSAQYRKEILSRLMAYRYGAAVVLHPDRHIAQILADASIPNRLGTSRRLHSMLFTHRLNHSRKENRKHESEYNLDFLSFFLDGPTTRLPELGVTRDEESFAREQIATAGITGQFVVVHPGSGGSADRWPMESFLQLAQRLQQDGFEVLITGGPAEKSTIETAMSTHHITIPSMLGSLDLRGLIAVLRQSRLTISNSTGPLHLAAAQSRPVVGLYPSRASMSPVRWGPLGDGHLIITPHEVCRCPERQCTCLEQISVETVFRQVRDQLRRNSGMESMTPIPIAPQDQPE